MQGMQEIRTRKKSRSNQAFPYHLNPRHPCLIWNEKEQRQCRIGR
jgi:hypothetical protein